MGNQNKNSILNVITTSVFRIVALFFAFFIGIAILFLNESFYHDDAYITLRYVDHFLNGTGIVWNPGEYVQGYTNFLNLIIIFLLGKFDIDLVLSTQLLGFAGFIGLIVLMISFGLNYKIENKRPVWHLPFILIITSVPFVVWSLGGLEGPLYSFWIAAGAFAFMKALNSSISKQIIVISGICFGLSILTRPDGIVFTVVTFSYLFLLILLNKDQRKKAVTNCLIFITVIILIILPYIIWQLQYYGDFVPNTFYAKTNGLTWNTITAGFKYLIIFSIRPPFLPAFFLFGFYYLVKNKLWDHKLIYLSLLIFAYLSFIVFVGGDHMPAFRFLLPVIPLMVMLFTMVLTLYIVKEKTRINAVNSTLIVLGFSALSIFDFQLNPIAEDGASAVGTRVGNYIAQEWPEGSLIALSTAGSTPYYAKNFCYIDMLGLNDAHIGKRKIQKIELENQNLPGHLKGDGAYILSRQPDYIIPGPAQGTEVEKPWFLSDLELSRQPKFKEEYELFKVKLKMQVRAVPTSPIEILSYINNRILGIKDKHSQNIVFTYYKRKDQAFKN